MSGSGLAHWKFEFHLRSEHPQEMIARDHPHEPIACRNRNLIDILVFQNHGGTSVGREPYRPPECFGN